MSADPSYERDLFVSYAHLDNETLTADEDGWVSAFDVALQKRVAQLLGRKTDVWRDRKLQGNDIFGDEILDQFPKLKAFISIVSPRYLESEWCRKELHEFYEASRAVGGVRVGNKSRIFKIIKTPVSQDAQPPEIADVLGYEFYQVDENERFREFMLDRGSPTYYQFIERFEDVAQDICHLIKTLDAGIPADAKEGGDPVEDDPARSVYLATTTTDLIPARDNIRRDLEQRGYRVLPDQELPDDSRFHETVEALLARCGLSVHLIGKKYGQVLEDETCSVVEVQHDLSQAAAVNRLIWLAETDSVSEDQRQRRFVSQLHDHAVAQPNTELLNGNLEELKTVIIDTLAMLAEPQASSGAVDGDSDLCRIYLMFDESDHDAAMVIDESLYEQGFEVLRPVFDGDEGDIRKTHQDNLKLCSGVLIYCDEATESWLNSKMNDLRKAPAYRDGKSLEARAVYLAGEDNRFKEHFRSREALVIKQPGAFAPADLASFVAQLKNGRNDC